MGDVSIAVDCAVSSGRCTVLQGSCAIEFSLDAWHILAGDQYKFRLARAASIPSNPGVHTFPSCSTA